MMLRVYTTISSSVLKHSLFKGFAIACLGIMGLVVGGVFFSPSTLTLWGFSLFLVSMGLMTYGLLPYRRLCRLQLNPYELSILDSGYLEFFSKGKKILTLPLQSIDQMSYIQDSIHYGIAVWVRPSSAFPIIVHRSPKEVDKLRQKGHKIGQATLFFPYFNQRAYDELMNGYEEAKEQK